MGETAEQAPLPGWAAGALVFGSSAAVLVIELVALRLLAPYLGLTLETNTVVIGTALAAIALGSWLGGQAADILAPRRALAPLLAVSGAVAALTPLAVRAAGGTGEYGTLVLVAGVTIVVPGALLSAVTPMVTKLMLTSLTETGTVVGRLSGIGTVGAILGTVVTGFVLISRVPVTGIMVGLGLALLVAAVVVEVGVRRRVPTVAVAVVLVAALVGGLAPRGCDAETTYHCASVFEDPARDTGRVLVLDTLRHSYVDLEDPTYLEFDYVRALAGATDTVFAPGEPLRAHHLGGGGVTFPRFLAETRPGTRSAVSEIDGGVVRLDRQQLGLSTDPDLTVRVEDGRLGLTRLEDDSHDLVVGDAFGGVSVPWHLTTREALAQVHRVLADDGLYAANLIDYGSLDFARAEVATLQEVFDHVVLAAAPDTLRSASDGGGNLVALASDAPIDAAAFASRLGARGVDWAVLAGSPLDALVGDAAVLTDDYAPVDQLLGSPTAPG